jgi:hypothetical protein
MRFLDGEEFLMRGRVGGRCLRLTDRIDPFSNTTLYWNKANSLTLTTFPEGSVGHLPEDFTGILNERCPRKAVGIVKSAGANVEISPCS